MNSDSIAVIRYPHRFPTRLVTRLWRRYDAAVAKPPKPRNHERYGSYSVIGPLPKLSSR